MTSTSVVESQFRTSRTLRLLASAAPTPPSTNAPIPAAAPFMNDLRPIFLPFVFSTIPFARLYRYCTSGIGGVKLKRRDVVDIATFGSPPPPAAGCAGGTSIFFFLETNEWRFEVPAGRIFGIAICGGLPHLMPSDVRSVRLRSMRHDSPSTSHRSRTCGRPLTRNRIILVRGSGYHRLLPPN